MNAIVLVLLGLGIVAGGYGLWGLHPGLLAVGGVSFVNVGLAQFGLVRAGVLTLGLALLVIAAVVVGVNRRPLGSEEVPA